MRYIMNILIRAQSWMRRLEEANVVVPSYLSSEKSAGFGREKKLIARDRRKSRPAAITLWP
jgi:hypothetical protein